MKEKKLVDLQQADIFCPYLCSIVARYHKAPVYATGSS